MESDKHLIIQGILSWGNARTPRETSQISFGLLQVVGSNPAAPTKYPFDLSHLLKCSSDAVLTLGSMLLQLCQRHDGGAKLAAVRNLSKCLHARRVLLWRVQFALKPASKALGLHWVFIRGPGLKYLIADSAFKRIQVDAPGACWLDADEHHRGLALRTGGALNCSEWNDGRQALRLGHDASLEQAGAQHSLSPVMPRRRSGDCWSMRLRDLKRELIRRYSEGKRLAEIAKPDAPARCGERPPPVASLGPVAT